MNKRTYLVTGASKGIGLSLAKRLDAQGHTVVGVARSVNDGSFPGLLVSVDLTDRAATSEALTKLAGQFAFDGIVNNFGSVKLARIGDVELDDLETGFRTNLVPALQTVQSILPGMLDRKYGRIVNVASLVVLGMPERSVYAAAKSALISFTRTWALELAETGITVNAIAPGPTETELFRANAPASSEAERRFLSLVPMRRFGQPSELAAAIAFFLSEDASFITGQTLFVDGGASIGKAST